MARFIAQIIIAGTQVVGRAFARALKQEMAASQEAARRLGNSRARSQQIGNLKMGLSLEEAKQILNVSNITREEIKKQYDFLFKNNEREKGGTFYIQSKIVRAKERLEHELDQSEAKEQQTEETSKS
ncbi:hypothetical protein ILUMI_05379 [Ignelater luminosus]|uniref:Uncharacterized protein n=1 Tax=Ignelater luminosus TaxID=2038154 RepID=A0A8K0GDN3_IGNLU|nr:hypothetical protein ILUMI_05379 [Ignelater luminosus]